MKPLENNWKQKTLETLEKDTWQESAFDSQLIRKTTALRKIPLASFSVEDLRIIIGQHMSLDYLIPLALEKLAENLLAEGDYYKGDLLKSVQSVPVEFWDNNPDLLQQFIIVSNKY